MFGLRKAESDIQGNDDDDDCKAKLQWRLQEIKVIKCGTLERLIECLGSEAGDIDSNFVNTFLATYRSFASAEQVLDGILKRYKEIGEDVKMKQHHKEGHQKSLKTVISLWLSHYTEDFHEPPQYRCLHKLADIAKQYMPESDLSQRATERLADYIKEDDINNAVSVEDITLDIHLDLLQDVDTSVAYIQRPVDLMNIPSHLFAQQLTYVDSDLFRKVVPHHCLGSVWSRRDKKHGQAPSVYATVNHFNAVSYRVVATILKHPYLPPLERIQIIEKWIDIAQELRVLKNFSSLKAIISALQSNPVYRLRRVWAELNKESSALFKELAEIFSEENNQYICRELLNREGTAKYADPDSTGTIKGHTRRKSSGWGTTRSRRSVLLQDGPLMATGTVPYLGTFLTDLTMVDAAIKDTTPEGLVNFEKKRKEFEILAQIRMLQAAAHTYRIKPEPAFFEWFHNVRVYDENESYELSCEIEPITSITPKEVRGHRKKSSLGFFSPRRPASMVFEGLFRYPSTGSIAGDDAFSVISAPELETPIRGMPQPLKHSISSGSIGSLSSQDVKVSPWKTSAESLVVKVFLETADSQLTCNYKSIMVSNSDHTKNVLRNILLKFNMPDKPEDFMLFQILPDKEIQLPDRGNIFYAISTNVPDIRFVMRRRTEFDKLRSRKYSRAKQYKFTM
ncbi:hypothetical protein LSH36_471g06064 [Paralvinella palmiformis]|uniref:Ral guanine nucleotide dissociation stimulator-like 1 n=1 Tax=Paralvinella palmiformis TaxID=53620 RepID=A0AAD9JAS9_9ANNE|nr:hypothetical protein LSH36_471g06064 [Paralvinella palmiformis]